MSKCNLQKFPKLCSQLPGSCFYSLAPECVLSTRESSYNMSLIVWEHNKPKDPSRLYTMCVYIELVCSQRSCIHRKTCVSMLEVIRVRACEPVGACVCIHVCVPVHMHMCVFHVKPATEKGVLMNCLTPTVQYQQLAVLRVLLIPYPTTSKARTFKVVCKHSRMNFQRRILF